MKIIVDKLLHLWYILVMEAIMLDVRKGMIDWLDSIAIVVYWIDYPTGAKLERKAFESYEKASEWVSKNRKMFKSVDIM